MGSFSMDLQVCRSFPVSILRSFDKEGAFPDQASASSLVRGSPTWLGEKAAETDDQKETHKNRQLLFAFMGPASFLSLMRLDHLAALKTALKGPSAGKFAIWRQSHDLPFENGAMRVPTFPTQNGQPFPFRDHRAFL